jgi:hypothetical protein
MTSFDYRRRLSREDWIRLGGVAASAATAVAGIVLYFGRIWLQRVPLPRGSSTTASMNARARAPRSPRSGAGGGTR